MISQSEVTKDLEIEKRRLLAELYLREKFKGRFDPAWLETMGNYTHLANAIDFFYKLGNDNLNIVALSSDNLETRKDHVEQFKRLSSLLDKLVVFTGDAPPRTTAFKEKDAVLAGIELNQGIENRSLRDLHAQNSNLGIAEKLLAEDLGQTEWLGEVDLERMLIKLNIKDRTHITRLNTDDIGMILHFERVKHAEATEPYTIPLLINCGSSGSLRSQGSHWTYAMVTVDPTANTVRIDYQDSMPLSGRERATLEDAINYQDGDYSAYPAYVAQVNVESDGLQRDGWSCGYRALKGLITTPGFPVNGGVNLREDWLRLAEAETESSDLRNAVYETLLNGLEINPDYFVAMKLDQEMVKSSTKKESYELDSKFTQNYLKLLTGTHAKNPITSTHFNEAYQKIIEELKSVTVETKRKETMTQLSEQINKIRENDSLSVDAKIIAILDTFATKYAMILESSGGKNSKLGKFIADFCLNNFGVELGKDSLYRLKTEGLAAQIINAQLETKSPKIEEGSLLPPIKKKSTESHQTSVSAPVRGTVKTIVPKVTPSADTITTEQRTAFGQPTLRKDKKLTRLGSMFGTSQFCYANKPGGVEPGFRAVDLNDLFFKELDTILADKNLPSDTKISAQEQLNFKVLREALNKVDLGQKQRLFSTFVHLQIPGPQSEGTLNKSMQWLCNQVKEAVGQNNKLSAWMYKLDYAEGQKDRVTANKEAIREFVGTRLAGIFSAQNQKQEIAWVNNGKNGTHALLACGWKNGLQELTKFLHGGKEPDYNGVLVEDKDAPVKRSKNIPGLGKNLIFGIAIGDRDGMGKDAQNKGFADGGFYGFDYGKPYEGEGVSASIDDDFSFEDSYAKAPSVFRGSSIIGVARHYMYRNYSAFYDTPLAERMEGFHLLRKMITGENPSEEVIKSNPGLRQELHRIQENTPTAKELIKQLSDIKSNCREGSPVQSMVNAHIIPLCTGKLSNYDLYFAKMKIDLIDMAVKSEMPYVELASYIKFIDEMAVQAQKSNQHILAAFEERRLLTKPEIDLIDKLEKIFSPTSAMSPDGTVFLNTLRFDPQSGRIPFQLKREDNGNYTLSTSNLTIAEQLNKELGLKSVAKDKSLNCTLTPEQLIKLMANTEVKYNQKREDLLIKPTYKLVTFPDMVKLVHKNNLPHEPKAEFGFLWHKDNSLSLRVVAKTEKQALEMQQIFKTPVKVNRAKIIEIPADAHQVFQNVIAKRPAEEQNQIQQKTMMSKERTVDLSTTLSQPSITTRWKDLHQQQKEEATVKSLTPAEQLIKRFEGIIREEKTLEQIKNAIVEITTPGVIQKLLQCNDKTLAEPNNIKAIIEERLGDVKEIADELVVTSTTNVSTVRLML